MKIVIVRLIFGGEHVSFGLSQKALVRLIELGMKVAKRGALDNEYDNADIVDYKGTDVEDTGGYGLIDHYTNHHLSYRTDKRIIQVVEELGSEASVDSSLLVVVEIPDDVEWYIERPYGGSEFIAEKHRTWGAGW